MRWLRILRRPRWTTRRLMMAILVIGVNARLATVAIEVDRGRDLEFEHITTLASTGEVMAPGDPRIRNVGAVSYLFTPGSFWPRYWRRVIGLPAKKITIRSQLTGSSDRRIGLEAPWPSDRAGRRTTLRSNVQDEN